MDPFRAIIPEDSDDYLRDNLIKGMKANASLGWTQTQDAGMAYRLVDLMKAIHDDGLMAHRVYATIPVSEAAELFRRGMSFTDDHLFSVRGIKVFIDGTLGSRGAALIENYADADHNGFMNRTTKEDLMPVLAERHQGGTDRNPCHWGSGREVPSRLVWGSASRPAPGSLGDRGSSVAPGTRTNRQPEDRQRFLAMKVLPSSSQATASAISISRRRGSGPSD